MRFFPQARHVLAMVGRAAVQQFVVGVRRIQEYHAVAQRLHRLVDIVGGHRDVLDAFAAVQVQVFLDLPLFGAFLVDRDTDIAAGRGHGLRLHAGHLAFDVEVADLAEIEQALVELGPLGHYGPYCTLLRQVVDQRQAGAGVVHVGLRGIAIDRLGSRRRRC